MTFNVWTFLLQIINFLVLAYVLHRLLYRPLRDAIDKRRQAHEAAQAEANQARDEARSLQQQLQTQIADFDRQRQETVRLAHEKSVAERQRMLNDTSRIVQQKQDAARIALAREREESLRALQTEIVGQALDLSRRLLTEAAGLTLDTQLAARLVETLRQLPQGDREELRRDWHPQDLAVLETAAELNGSPIVEHITATMNDILGQTVSLNVVRRESLIGGARLRLGGHVWDASIAGQLDSLSHAGARGLDHA